MPDRPPAVRIMQNLGLEPDPWQVEVLEAGHPRLLLNCCRQAGKSTTVALLALVEAVFVPFTKILLVSRSHRQSGELLRIVANFHRQLGEPLLERRNSEELSLTNHSRIVSLPCREETIRGYSNVSLLVIDEAARVPDDLYRAVRPMLAVSNGRLYCLSTPYGKRGFFYDAWVRGGGDWARIEVPAAQIPRIRPETLELERRGLGEAFFRQEYCCSFESMEGLVYPDFARCLTADQPPAGGRNFGGIDFGFHNPFAAVWGVLDRDDILWLTGEHYVRAQDLGYHAEHLPRKFTWFGDPSGASERATLHRLGIAVRRGNNAVRAGLAAVTARLRQGMLRVVAGRCPNLLHEAGLYRWRETSSEQETEEPDSGHNHALDALRYLVMGIDRGRPPRPRAPAPGAAPALGACPTLGGSALGAGLPTPPPPGPPPVPEKPKEKWLRYDNEALWTTLR